jgi:hypothetical protein
MKTVQMRLDHLWVQDQRRMAVGDSMVQGFAGRTSVETWKQGDGRSPRGGVPGGLVPRFYDASKNDLLLRYFCIVVLMSKKARGTWGAPGPAHGVPGAQ